MARRRIRRRNYSFNTYTETNRNLDLTKNALIWIFQIAIVVMLGFLTVKFGGQTLTIRGESLEDTYRDGDVVFVNKLIYKIAEPKQYDMVAFKADNSDGNHYSIKRVVAVPGDHVIIEDGVLKVNGEPLEGFPAFSEIVNPGLAKEEITLEDEYFVMGDNCNNSEDSRVVSVGNIKKENMIGKVQFKLYHKEG